MARTRGGVRGGGGGDDGKKDDDDDDDDDDEEEEDGDGMVRLAKTRAETVLEKVYFDAAKTGVVLTMEDLRRVCKKRRLRCSDEMLRSMRYRFKYVAMHARYRKPSHYMGSSIDRLGTIQVDMAHFMPRLKVANKQCDYFLLGVDSLTGFVSIVPCTNKNQRSWERGVVKMLDDFPHVGHIITDQDGAVTPRSFRDRVKRDYGVSWSFLTARSKAFKAERMIRWAKERLSMALQLNERGDNDWIQHVPTLVRARNAEVIPGTSIVRSEVTKSNYLDLLEELFGSDAPTMLFNASHSRDADYSRKLAGKIWRFDVGERVLLARDANYRLRKGPFAKRSVTGAYEGRVYRVSARELKSNRKLFLSVVYRLEGVPGLFYESELRKAYFVSA